jgi:AbiV family abortive infection protein
MAEEFPTIDRAFQGVLVRGAEKTLDSAEKLYFEAEILARAGAIARSLCLHQISLEECPKSRAWAHVRPVCYQALRSIRTSS